MLTDVKDKLRKLQRLAEAATNEGEVAAARKQFTLLCLKYGIVADDVTFDAEEDGAVEEQCVESPEPLYEQGKLVHWKYRLAHALGQVNGVYFWAHSSRVWDKKKLKSKTKQQLMMVGVERDIQTVRYLFSVLEKDVERLSRLHCRGVSRTWGNNFRHGVVDALADKVKEAYGEAKDELQREGNTRALVRLSDALVRVESARDLAHRLHPNLRARSGGGGGAGDNSARAAGRAAGKTVDVKPQTQGLAAGRRLLTG